MTGLEFGIGLGIVFFLFGLFLYLEIHNEIQEKKSKALQEAADVEKIKQDIANEPISEVLDYVKRRKPPGES